MTDGLVNAFAGFKMANEAASSSDSLQPKGWKQQVIMGADVTTGQSTSTAGFERYEYKEEYGEVAPDIEEFRLRLYADCHGLQASELSARMMDAKVDARGPKALTPFKTWNDAGLHPVLLENISHMKYQGPTPIQQFVIPAMQRGFDVMAISQTGSGKTAAYLVPIVNKFMGKIKLLSIGSRKPGIDFQQGHPLALIIVPTRELAVQIFKDACRLVYRSKIRVCLAYGGVGRRSQIDDIQRGCDILIGTPGRLADIILNNPTSISLSRLKYTILDEADELLTEEWTEQIEKLVGASSANADHNHAFFSATFPGRVRRLARQSLSADYYRLTIGRMGSTHDGLHYIVYADESVKPECILDLLRDPQARGRTVIFCNFNNTVERVESELHRAGFPVVGFHGGLLQMEREEAVQLFNNNKAQIIVCSGVAARGLDFTRVNHVINYDLPRVEHGGITEYVHRAGRTNRGGLQGQATSLFNDEKDAGIAPDLVSILLETRNEIPDFLEKYKHVDEKDNPIFDDCNSDSEDEPVPAATGGDAWGTAPADADSAWGAEPATVSDSSWGAAEASGGW